MSSEADRAAYREKLQSLAFRATTPGVKKTVDVHDNHKVETTEHWNDRVDLTVKPDTIRLKGPNAESV